MKKRTAFLISAVAVLTFTAPAGSMQANCEPDPWEKPDTTEPVIVVCPSTTTTEATTTTTGPAEVGPATTASRMPTFTG